MLYDCFLDHTTGMFCDTCVTGAFGDAKSPAGCKPCDCNGHGVADLGFCHNVTGKCFCKDLTHGNHCEICNSPLKGNPRYAIFLNFYF